jgi:hypothetical protein
MATHRSPTLPWIKKPYENDPAAFNGKRLQFAVIQEAAFVQMLRFERRRTERSGKKFMLILISSKDFVADGGDLLINNLMAAISSSTRETDVLGWYERDVRLGLLLTEIGGADESTINIIMQKISLSIQNAVCPDKYACLKLAVRVFPQEVNDDLKILLRTPVAMFSGRGAC